MMENYLYYLIAIGSMLLVAMACSITKDGFSSRMFLLAIAIANLVVVWIGIFPYYFILLSIGLVISIFFGNPEGAPSE
jgi:hypothetical protein